jgi:NitT/TauT family transport system substrate-binding protein
MNTRKPLMTMLVAASLLLAGAHTTAWAAGNEIRIARQFGLGYLPTMIMQHEKLLEKHAGALGIQDVDVKWMQLGNAAAMNDAMLSGNLDFASGAVTAPIIVWDKTRGTREEIKGVCGESVIPFTLFTNKPDVKSIKDFAPGDQIAVTGIKVTTYAILLQMEAAKAFGKKNYAKVDPLTVSMAHPDAITALFSGQIAAHFTWPPYSYLEARKAGIHKVFDSTDVMGGRPMSSTVIWARKAFRDQHPKLYQAFVAAMQESIDFIKANKSKAAEIYVEMTNSKEPIQQMLEDPTITFDMAPHGVMKFATFMHDIGTLKNQPHSWKDLYFAEVHEQAGD